MSTRLALALCAGLLCAALPALAGPSAHSMEEPPRLGRGDLAPGGTLFTSAGEPVELAELLDHGGPTLLFFYMTHSCAGCMAQIGLLAEHMEDFAALDARIIGVSSDDPAGCLKSEANLAKMEVSDVLIFGDPGLDTIEAYGVRIPETTMATHAFFLIDAEGRIGLVARGDHAPEDLPSPAILLSELRRLVDRAASKE